MHTVTLQGKHAGAAGIIAAAPCPDGDTAWSSELEAEEGTSPAATDAVAAAADMAATARASRRPRRASMAATDEGACAEARAAKVAKAGPPLSTSQGHDDKQAPPLSTSVAPSDMSSLEQSLDMFAELGEFDLGNSLGRSLDWMSQSLPDLDLQMAVPTAMAAASPVRPSRPLCHRSCCNWLHVLAHPCVLYH